jgi:uncharacterized membrane protein
VGKSGNTQQRDGRGHAGSQGNGERDRVREEKRAQFQPSKGSRRPIFLLAAVAVIAAVALSIAFWNGEDETTVTTIATAPASGADATTPAGGAASPAGGKVAIPVADVSDGAAKFFSYDVAGVEVKYFVVKSSDGEIRAAFDACDVCFAEKRGYEQQGDEMVCNNCGRRFPSVSINVEQGGCNPSPLDRQIVGDELVIDAAAIEAGARFFQ